MSFEIQELPDILRVVVLLSLSKGSVTSKETLKRQVDRICATKACIDSSDLEKALKEMAAEGLITSFDNSVKLTEQGIRLGKEWRSLLLKKDPVLEVVAGLVDGSITGLVIILSAFVAGLTIAATGFAASLTLAAVAITNFSSFLLGGITEDLADMMTLQTLMNYSLGDISDGKERGKSLTLVKQLFYVLRREINRANLYAATICSITTFLAGVIPVIAYLLLPQPFNIALSLSLVGAVIGIFLVRYRSRKTKVHWKITLFETIAIVTIAVLASLLIGSI